jgi:hypothetical protein
VNFIIFTDHLLQYLQDVQHSQLNLPLVFNKTTPLYELGEPASLLMVTNTQPPLSLLCQQLPHTLLCPSHPFTPPKFKLHYLHRQHQQFSVVFIWDKQYAVCHFYADFLTHNLF